MNTNRQRAPPSACTHSVPSAPTTRIKTNQQRTPQPTNKEHQSYCPTAAFSRPATASRSTMGWQTVTASPHDRIQGIACHKERQQLSFRHRAVWKIHNIPHHPKVVRIAISRRPTQRSNPFQPMTPRFDKFFQAATGKTPYIWQCRLACGDPQPGAKG